MGSFRPRQPEDFVVVFCTVCPRVVAWSPRCVKRAQRDVGQAIESILTGEVAPGRPALGNDEVAAALAR